MGTVVAFPAERSSKPGAGPASGAAAGSCAQIYILPVVRIERHASASPPGRPAPRPPDRPRRFLP
ncbi:hypothetical protein EDC64_10994 [Aquabacter spiritensis]|uniref:Uncharacterized protein n=1 Tax=Aquabacter spiritensis TaxID=933073 RepID=A0A4R3LSK3_9HYPH|nr:hypothetical protein EDC64_10994 [Aquabacter spiritensis]